MRIGLTCSLDPEARAVTLLRMPVAGQDALHHLGFAVMKDLHRLLRERVGHAASVFVELHMVVDVDARRLQLALTQLADW